ncbi:DcaP family trimeric outer membrane transporter [Ottowia sp.]|uniref:DcaP family trimeric outer membrane transporter n=1 Tax=Ottowia sp. TaxID=1898956 RepID=UPI003A8BD1FF
MRTIRELQERVNALEQQQKKVVEQQAAATVNAPQPVAPLSPAETATFIPASTLKDNETAALRVDNATIDPELKGFFRIPGTDTIMKFGGYAKLDLIYDTKPIGTYDYFITSALPTSGANRRRGTQFTVHAKQTRINLDIRRQTDVGKARMFIEGDFFGDASWGYDSGGYEMRLRHAYGQLGNIAAGYGFSAFMDNDALPDTLDFEGPGAAPYLLTAGARYTWKINKNYSFGLAAERPNSEITTSDSGYGRSTMPDLVAIGRYETDAGHLQASGLLRRLAYRDDDGHDDAWGYGLNVAGTYTTFGSDYLAGGAVWGKGISRYVSDLSGNSWDAVAKPNGQLDALTSYGGYLAYTHYWTPKLRSTGVAGYLGMDRSSAMAGTSFKNSQYYSANLIWNPWGSLNVGAELLYGRLKTMDGRSANDTRIQFSLQYDFVR